MSITLYFIRSFLVPPKVDAESVWLEMLHFFLRRAKASA
jgi:hypothetical protein